MKIIPYLSFFICFFHTIFGQSAGTLPLDSAVNNLIAQNIVFPQEKVYLQTDKPYYISGEKIFFRAFLLDASLHQPVTYSRYVYVELINPAVDTTLIRLQIRPQSNMFSGHVPIPEDLEQGDYILRAYTRFMMNPGADHFFTRPVYIANPKGKKAETEQIKPETPDFDVSFYPEGGHIIAGQVSCVAFKALASNGENITIRGELYDSENNLLTEFSTFHDGMGVIRFRPEPGERYHSICYYENRQIKVNLPEVKNNTVSLKTSWRQNKLWVNVNKPDNFDAPRLYLIVHARGRLIYADEWDAGKEALTINKTEFPSGVSHVLLLTEDYQTVSERLVFALNDDQAAIQLQASEKIYGKREKVTVDFALLQFELTDSITGSFAVSVTDDRDIKTDSTNNILSSILLTSDLKGYIHNPVFYLQKNDKKADLSADMLMMTQGWTRYDIPKVLRGDFRLPEILPEKSQVISGTVKNGLLSKSYAGAKLTLVSSIRSFFEMGEADENGKFSYSVELPDSTTYLIKAMNRKDKKSMIELFVEKPVYPDINMDLNALMAKQNMIEEDIQDYVTKADAKYVQENGIRTVDLPEVVVKGRRTENKYRSSLASIFTERITEEQLEQMHAVNIHSILRRLPRVWATGQSISVRGATPLVLIDGMVMNYGRDPDQTIDVLNTINVSDIGQVEFIKGVNAVVYGPEGSSGVIEIFTKRGEFKPVTKPNINMKMLMPLGYQKPVEFYSPKYDTPEAKANKDPDLRSVIYWKPDVLIDSDGKASFDFYTADSPSTYTIVIEGITNDGKLIYLKVERFISVE